MSHTDPAILALSALGEQAGSAQDDAHTAHCADCQRELERLSGVVELARKGGPVLLEQPPATVWDRIAAAAGEDVARPGPAPTAAAAAAPGRVRRGRRKLVAAGAAAGLVIGIGGTVAVTQLTRPPASQVVAQIELRPLPQFPQWQGAAGTAILRKTSAAPELAVSVTAPRRTGFYEVWLLGTNGTSMISLGDLNAADAGTFALPAGANLRFYSRIDVSLQPFNGSTLHSSTSVVRGSMPPAAASAAEG